MNYFLIPGNPPAVHFYELWRKEIMAAHPWANVRVSPYPVLKPANDSGKVMREVLDAHRNQFLEFHREVDSPVNVVGHSLGAYFAYGILEADPAPVARAILVHPFLRAPRPLGRMILKAVGSLHAREGLQKALVRGRKALEYLSSDFLHVTDEELVKIFHLARHEGVVIGRDRSPLRIRADLKDKIRAFYTPRDTWVSDPALKDFAREISIQECPEPHGFITEERHRKQMFERINSMP